MAAETQPTWAAADVFHRVVDSVRASWQPPNLESRGIGVAAASGANLLLFYVLDQTTSECSTFTLYRADNGHSEGSCLVLRGRRADTRMRFEVTDALACMEVIADAIEALQAQPEV